MTRRAHDDQVTEAITRWLEALASVPVGSVSSMLEQHARLGCRVQSSRCNRGLRLVGLSDAEAPMRCCTRRELLALALRYSGPAEPERQWVNDVWCETVRPTLRPYREIGAVLGCSGPAVRGLIERGRAKVGSALEAV